MKIKDVEISTLKQEKADLFEKNGKNNFNLIFLLFIPFAKP